MRTYSAENERVKRRYFVFLKDARRQSDATVDAVASALHRFEALTKYRDFRAFHFEQAVAFKRHLSEQHAVKSGERLSKATINSTLSHLKRFFQWLSGEPGYRSRLKYSEAAYFNLSEKDTRIATARRETAGPTPEQMRHVIGSMPAGSEIERRNRALLAFAFLTGARDSALASMRLKHVDVIAGCVHQDAREVKTKFSKTFVTDFFPVGDEVRQIVVEWMSYLRVDKLFGNDDPLFPATLVEVGDRQQFEAAGLSRIGWRSAAPIRAIFRAAFENAGIPYFPPHKLRNTLVRLGETLCRSPEEFKAWSQNLGHDDVMTTFSSYGEVPRRRQAEIIARLGQAPAAGDDRLMAAIAEAVRAART